MTATKLSLRLEAKNAAACSLNVYIYVYIVHPQTCFDSERTVHLYLVYLYTVHCPSLSHESILVAITAPKPQTARAKPPHLLLYVFSMGRELWLSKLKLDTREKCMRTK